MLFVNATLSRGTRWLKTRRGCTELGNTCGGETANAFCKCNSEAWCPLVEKQTGVC
jgi:hypothetical protein